MTAKGRRAPRPREGGVTLRDDLKALLGLTEADCAALGRRAEATAGSIEEPGLTIRWFGACAIQGVGEVDGHPCYYRARCDGLFEVFPAGTDLTQPAEDWPEPIWSTELDADGWDEASATAANIRAAVARFRGRGA